MANITTVNLSLVLTGLTLVGTAVCPAALAFSEGSTNGPLSEIDSPWTVGQGIQVTQSIIPAADGTGTVVNSSGNQFTIEDGTTSGANLFHSFEQLNLSADQVATFLAQPEIQNILGRVTGGDPSLINGLLQVSGSQANLFLMNPAGIIFGPNAQISVPGSFTATTANGIQLGDYWFTAMGVNDYANLAAPPSGFAFTTDQPGAVVNTGSLSVPQGESVTLLGGAVLNLGTISAPGGDITIAAVPGERFVRISQTGSLISLDLPINMPDSVVGGDRQPVSITDLLAPLSGGGQTSDLAWVVEGDVVQLASSGANLPTQPGAATVAGTLNTAGDGSGGRVNVLGQQVSLVGATIDASGNGNGGQIRLGGDYQGQGTLPNAEQTYISADSTINADAGTIGDGGEVIIWADGTTRFYGSVTARGGSGAGDGGFVEVSGRNNLVYRGQVAAGATNGQPGTLLLDPENIMITPGGGGGFNGVVDANGPGPTIITQAQLEDSSLANVDVRLEATNDIRIVELQDHRLTFARGNGSITFTADADKNGNGAFLTYNSQAIEQVGNSEADNNGIALIQTNGRDLSISGASIITGGIKTGFALIGDEVGAIRAGNVNLESSIGNIIVRFIDTSLFLGDGVSPAQAGDITIDANQFFRATGVTSGGNQDATVSLLAAGSLIDPGADGSNGAERSSFFGGEVRITHGGLNGFTTGARAIGSPVDENEQIFQLELVENFTFLDGQSGTRGAIISRNTNGVRRSVYLDQELATPGLGETINISFREPNIGGGNGSGGGNSNGGGDPGDRAASRSPEVCDDSGPNRPCGNPDADTTSTDQSDDILDVSEVMPEP